MPTLSLIQTIRIRVVSIFILSAGLLATGCAVTSSAPAHAGSGSDSLVGAWRGKVQFKTGGFPAVKDLEFMYVFNAGGTMTESSN